MWTVDIIRHNCLSSSFDLNYVGCERSCARGFRKTQTRLIWTMWDVNMTAMTAVEEYDPRLIWTMWDVNRWICGFSTSLPWFDLNYVGCEQGGLKRFFYLKGVWSELCGMWTWRSFRLTLAFWVFDLNYVGCERWGHAGSASVFRVWSELCGMWTKRYDALHQLHVKSLIWTMWDVNVITHKAFYSLKISLIWTMWDVNWYRWV